MVVIIPTGCQHHFYVLESHELVYHKWCQKKVLFTDRMVQKTSTQQQVAARVERFPCGQAILARDLLGFGSRDAVDQALVRLVRRGVLVRVGRGVYARPEIHPVLGEVPLPVEEIVRAYRERSGAKVQIAGAAAVNLLGLSTQVPVGTHFYTDGPTHRITRGKQVIYLQHVNPKVLACAGTAAAPFLSCLYFLGRDGVTSEAIFKLADRFTPEVREALTPALPQMIEIGRAHV